MGEPRESWGRELRGEGGWENQGRAGERAKGRERTGREEGARVGGERRGVRGRGWGGGRKMDRVRTI